MNITGTAAHIYAASRSGPRGDGELSAEDRSRPENAVWLCETHGKLIDGNAGAGFSAPLLRSWRDLREARASREQGGQSIPFGWVQSIDLERAAGFHAPTSISLSKATALAGANGSGKSRLLSILVGSAELHRLRPWQADAVGLAARIHWYDPDPHFVAIDVDALGIRITTDQGPQPFAPRLFRVIWLDASKCHIGISNASDMNDLSINLGLDPVAIENLLPRAAPWLGISELTSGGGRIYARFSSGRVASVYLSEGERLLVVLAIAVAAAEVSSQAGPTMLIIDGFFPVFDDRRIEIMLDRLTDPRNQFQSLITDTSERTIFRPEWNRIEFSREPDGLIALKQ